MVPNVTGMYRDAFSEMFPIDLIDWIAVTRSMKIHEIRE